MNKINKKDYLLTLVIVSIIILALFTLAVYLNLSSIYNTTNDSLTELLVFVLQKWIVPYMLITILLQGVVGGLVYLNKEKKLFDIVMIILELIYFIFTNLIVNPFVLFNFVWYSEILTLILLVLYEILNIIILILVVKRLIMKIKNKSKNRVKAKA